MTMQELNALAIAQGWAGGAHWHKGAIEVHHYPNPDLTWNTPYYVAYALKDETEQDTITRAAEWVQSHHCRDVAPRLYAAYNPAARAFGTTARGTDAVE